MTTTVSAPNPVQPVPSTMRAAIYRGEARVMVESVPVPEIGPGELLIEVAVCGVCPTDVKKIHANLLPPPRIYGHETAGVVAAVGAGVTAFQPGDRVVAFHHIPCRNCFYCRAKVYAQCPVYKKVGITAGFEPAGGGYANYVRVMDWIVRSGVVRVPDGVSYEEACLVEPVNTCLKAVRQAGIGAGQTVLVQGQGPIGLMLLMLAKREGARVLVSDPMDERLAFAAVLGERFAPDACLNPRHASVVDRIKDLTGERGADAVLVAAAAPSLVAEALEAVRPGGRVMLFAQTSRKDHADLPLASICVDEKQLIGSYSADIDLQDESAKLVFDRELPLRKLISHRFSLDRIEEAVALANHPQPDSLKIVVEVNAAVNQGMNEVTK
jgi:L-iditol 2-dehydrogenase